MISPNCSGSLSRPIVVMLYWNAWSVGRWVLSNLPRGNLDILLADCAQHVLGGQVARLELLRGSIQILMP